MRPAASISTISPNCWTAIPRPPSPSSAKPRSAIRPRKPGRPTTPICRVPSAPNSRSPRRRRNRILNIVRNVAALRRVQPEDLRPSDITARLGAPWIPAADIEAFAAEVMGTATHVRHTVEIAAWSVETAPFAYTAAGTSEWGTSRRNAGWLLHDALNNATPQIFDTDHRRRRGEARPQRRGDRGRQGKAGADQGSLHSLDLDRSRPHRPAGARFTTTASTISCRAISTGGI